MVRATDGWERGITGSLPQIPGVRYYLRGVEVIADFGNRSCAFDVRTVLEMDYSALERRILDHYEYAAAEAAARSLYGVSYHTVLRVNYMLGIDKTDTTLQLEDDLERREREANRITYANLTGGGGARSPDRFSPDD